MGLLDSVLGAAVGGALGRGGFGGGGLGGALGGALGGGLGRGGRGGVLGSPVVKALLLALAAKAAHEYMSRNRAGAGGQPLPGSAGGGGLGGVLGQILGGGQGAAGGGLGGLGGLLGGLGGAGALSELVEQFNRRGHGDSINSWVSAGPNQPIQPQASAEVLGPENLAELEQETGMPQPQLLEALSHELPEAIDQITPQGRLPSDAELLDKGG